MIRITRRVQKEHYEYSCISNVIQENLITTIYFLFIPVYRTTKILSWKIA